MTDTQTLNAAKYAADADEMIALLEANYAYLDRFAGNQVPISDKLRAEQRAVHDETSLSHFMSRVLLALADHHAGSHSPCIDDWLVVPTLADLWVVHEAGAYIIDAVRPGSPAAKAGIVERAVCEAVDGKPIRNAVEEFWAKLGLEADTDERRGFAARLLMAGKRCQDRKLRIRDGSGYHDVILNDLFRDYAPFNNPLSVETRGTTTRICFHNSLMGMETVRAFDSVMKTVSTGQQIVLDLTNTPSGGNTVVARAIMGWFVDTPIIYQIHRHPGEERQTGIPRQWMEQVLPRPGHYHDGPVSLRVGRWTGSLGEGIALAMRHAGHEVCGHEMAGLLGAVYDFSLTHSGLGFSIPAERLYAPDGTPRETARIN